MLCRNRRPQWTSLLAVGLFLALLVLTMGRGDWVVSADGTIPTRVPPSGGGGGPAGPDRGPASADSTRATSTSTSTGVAILGTATATVPSTTVPPGSIYTTVAWSYSTSSVPTGPQGAGFRGPGGNGIGVLVTDQNGNIIHSLPLPGLTICLSYPASVQLPDYGAAVQWWSGSAWVSLPSTLTGPVDGLYTVCSSVTSF